MNTNKLKAALLALLLFGIGTAFGALAHRYWVTASVVAKSSGSDDYRSKYVSDMQSRLKLSPHQVDQLQVILDETKDKVKAVHDVYHPQIVQIKNAQIEKVKAILSSEQAKTYQVMVAEHEQHAKEQEARDRQEEIRQREAHAKALSGQ